MMTIIDIQQGGGTAARYDGVLPLSPGPIGLLSVLKWRRRHPLEASFRATVATVR